MADDEVCGCPLVADVFTNMGQFCRAPKKKCLKHFSWEKLRRAELDMERVRRLTEYWKSDVWPTDYFVRVHLELGISEETRLPHIPPIPLFHPRRTPIPVLLSLPMHSGLVSPLHGYGGYPDRGCSWGLPDG